MSPFGLVLPAHARLHALNDGHLADAELDLPQLRREDAPDLCRLSGLVEGSGRPGQRWRVAIAVGIGSGGGGGGSGGEDLGDLPDTLPERELDIAELLLDELVCVRACVRAAGGGRGCQQEQGVGSVDQGRGR